MMMIVMMMIKQTDDQQKYDNDGRGWEILLSRVHLKLNKCIEGNYVWRCKNNYDDDDDDTVEHIGGRQVFGRPLRLVHKYQRRS